MLPFCNPAMLNWDDMALVGRIARAHGIKGQVIVNPDTDFPQERFKAGATGEILIPLATEICRTIDVAGKRIVIEPPEGLLDLNA